jgi:hypothetical protein
MKQVWYNPSIEYLFNNEIFEYDIKDAGISVIQEYKLLDDTSISKLLKMEKNERHVSIGLLRGENKQLSTSMTNKFADVRRSFISANNLTDNEMICVKNDAIFTIGMCKRLKFGKVEFTTKNNYTSYIRLSDNTNIELFYVQNQIDVKGIGDNTINRHRLYMLEFLRKSISYLESKDSDIKRFLKNFITEYKYMKLDDGYYIEFNNLSKSHNPVFNYRKVIIPIINITLMEIA